MDLSNRVALLTGGKRIGAVVATELANRGADIGLCYNRSRDEAEKTAESIRQSGRRVFIRQANLTQAADCEAFVNEAAAELGRLDVLVNMASIYVAKPFSELTVEEYRREYRGRHALGIHLLARRVAAHAARRRRPYHQLFRLAFAERPAALHRLPAVLRCEDRRYRHNRGARTGARAGQNPRQCHRARPDSRAAGHDGRRAGIRGKSNAAGVMGRRESDRRRCARAVTDATS